MKDWIAHNRWPLLAGVVAVLVRLVVLFEFSRHAGFTVPMVDEKWHWEWAREIIEGPFWGDTAWFRAPLYMYFLAVLRWLTAGSVFWAKFLQIFVCFGTAVLVYKLAEKLFGDRAAFVAALMYAFYGTLALYETLFLIPILFVFFLVWGMYRMVSHRDSPLFVPWLLTGIVFGLATISRPNVLLVTPFLMVWIFFTRRRSASFFGRLKTPVALVVGVALVVMPVTIRNAIVTGDFILVSSQGGVNLYLGNNPYANGLTMLMPDVELDESLSWRDFIPLTEAAAEQQAGRELSPAEESSFWTHKAIDFVRRNPGKFLELVWKKTVYLLSGFENSDNMDVYHERSKSVLYSILLWRHPLSFPFGVLLPLALGGLYLRRRDTALLAPLYVFIIAYAPSIILFLVTARHRLPLVPFLIVIAAGGLVALFERWKETRRRERVVYAAVVVITAALLNHTYFEEGFQNTFQIHFNNGIKYERLEDYASAEREYLLADEYYPLSAPLVNNLAHTQYVQGKYDEADRNFHRAISLNPGYGRPYNNLGLLVRDRGDLDSALTLFRMAIQRFDTVIARPNELGLVYLNLADLHESLRNMDSAAAMYLKAVESAPLLGDAYFKAAAFFARQEQYELTDSLFVRGRKVRDLAASDYFNWALSHIERRQFSAGIVMLINALKRDPELFQAHYLMAVCHLEGGSPRDSVDKYLGYCLELNPDYQPAVRLAEALK